MKANEFVKRFGWGEAQKCLPYCSKRGDFIYYKNIEVNFNELKRLVESHELLKKHNGLESAKHDLYTAKKVGMYIIWGTSIDLLRQSIADVESCQ